ncbi:deoxyribodipyrimidine photolyase [Enterovibrio norvegicus FF-162]|uniref:cryptochrome/photolyase family protein n=1 Tax=Enterovibrio norvegicus TaxID=188144 RepID=UPI00030A9847|nr:cryptochrome/photolyase family protein [Enterovibrio norvegicus]OEE89575.1 deoxyribodipyrimidine photolyase [Enterovibrio norvegicus FF-162]
MTATYSRLRLILGDQLNASHSWFKEQDDDTLYVIAELHQEASYVPHHVQKVCAFFAAMSAFAQALQQAGHRVLHLTLDDTAPFSDLPALLTHLIEQHGVSAFEYQLPDEYRLRQQLAEFANTANVEGSAIETEHFYLSEQQLRRDFQTGKKHRMEAFYRKMRVRFNVLMDGDDPQGGQWNFDADNRNKLKAKDIDDVPEPLLFGHDVTDILARIERHKIKVIGKPDSNLLWPITRTQANELLTFFCQHCLPNFGRFQDAMTGQIDEEGKRKQWSLYHSRLSFALNSKILSPQHVVDAAIHHYHTRPDEISLAQVEGFVRQIIGWREFIRGIYWVNMPEYATLNSLSATRDLPSWFWTADTKMSCLKHAIGQSLDYAYAHHIQRLMITGNFCLISGIEPAQVDEWYLGIYIDAIEWVELPNTRGMSQFADGGIVGSKAYAASGNYVKKMSDYCGNCHYKVAKTTEDDACPLNALYWHFMDKHQDDFGGNPRTKMVYANWNKKTDEQKQAVLDKAARSLQAIEQL